MSLYDDLLKPYTYEDYLALSSAETPLTREEFGEWIDRPLRLREHLGGVIGVSKGTETIQ